MFIYHENASSLGSFTRTGDAYAVDEDLRIAAVADSPLRELLRSTLRRYPQDDHGYEAATIFCNSMVESLNKVALSKQEIGKVSFRKALQNANKKINELNVSLNKIHKDYMSYDCAETVGVAAVQYKNHLIYGGLEDCYVFVLRGESLENIAPFEYHILHSGKYVEESFGKRLYFDEFPDEITKNLPPEALWEPIWCNVLRNNSTIADEKGKQIGWGCFTGEKSAEDFFQVHELEVISGDHILLFSDGMIPLLTNQQFVKWFVGNVNPNFEFELEMRKYILQLLGGDNIEAHKEKTLIHWQV